jgi:hypothetical protein
MASCRGRARASDMLSSCVTNRTLAESLQHLAHGLRLVYHMMCNCCVMVDYKSAIVPCDVEKRFQICRRNGIHSGRSTHTRWRRDYDDALFIEQRACQFAHRANRSKRRAGRTLSRTVWCCVARPISWRSRRRCLPTHHPRLLRILAHVRRDELGLQNQRTPIVRPTA